MRRNVQTARILPIPLANGTSSHPFGSRIINLMNGMFERTDESQAKSRVLVVLGGTLLVLGIFFSSDDLQLRQRLLIPAITGVFGLLFSLLWWYWMKQQANGLVSRPAYRYAALFVDAAMLTACFIVAGTDGMGIYALYLWLIVANGFRFGSDALHMALYFSLVGIASVAVLSPHWDLNAISTAGLLIGLFIVSKTYDMVLFQLNDINDRLHWQSTHDPLTRVANRLLLDRALDDACLASRRFALFVIDIDDFKTINDQMGHFAGDELLRNLSNRLMVNIKEDDIVARIGGDEFIIMAYDIETELEARHLAQRLTEHVSKPYALDSVPHEVYVTVSTGIVLTDGTKKNPDRLLQQADNAMYSAKKRGKNAFEYSSGAGLARHW